MKIVVDAMGGDFAPLAPVKGALMAHEKYGTDIVLTGREHAIMDALLGAAALGDIGKHFPDTDEKYEGISSLKLLDCTCLKLREAGYEICIIDSTVIAQRPKLASYIDEMRENIAKACKVDLGCVSVKATTEEGLGFTGRGEGIAATAVTLLRRICNE